MRTRVQPEHGATQERIGLGLLNGGKSGVAVLEAEEPTKSLVALEYHAGDFGDALGRDLADGRAVDGQVAVFERDAVHKQVGTVGILEFPGKVHGLGVLGLLAEAPAEGRVGNGPGLYLVGIADGGSGDALQAVGLEEADGNADFAAFDLLVERGQVAFADGPGQDGQALDKPACFRAFAILESTEGGAEEALFGGVKIEALELGLAEGEGDLARELVGAHVSVAVCDGAPGKIGQKQGVAVDALRGMHNAAGGVAHELNLARRRGERNCTNGGAAGCLSGRFAENRIIDQPGCAHPGGYGEE